MEVRGCVCPQVEAQLAAEKREQAAKDSAWADEKREWGEEKEQYEALRRDYRRLRQEKEDLQRSHDYTEATKRALERELKDWKKRLAPSLEGSQRGTVRQT
jgi:predicted RNase H-like nuclease (RuvC/YqgF family)